MDFTRQELEDAHLLVVVDELGLFKWSSKRSNGETAAVLRAIADDVEQRTSHRRGMRLHHNGHSGVETKDAT